MNCKQCKTELEEHLVGQDFKRVVYLCPTCGCNYDDKMELINKVTKGESDEEGLGTDKYYDEGTKD